MATEPTFREDTVGTQPRGLGLTELPLASTTQPSSSSTGGRGGQGPLDKVLPPWEENKGEIMSKVFPFLLEKGLAADWQSLLHMSVPGSLGVRYQQSV